METARFREMKLIGTDTNMQRSFGVESKRDDIFKRVTRRARRMARQPLVNIRDPTKIRKMEITSSLENVQHKSPTDDSLEIKPSLRLSPMHRFPDYVVNSRDSTFSSTTPSVSCRPQPPSQGYKTCLHLLPDQPPSPPAVASPTSHRSSPMESIPAPDSGGSAPAQTPPSATLPSIWSDIWGGAWEERL